jgi:hypothetical protein
VTARPAVRPPLLAQSSCAISRAIGGIATSRPIVKIYHELNREKNSCVQVKFINFTRKNFTVENITEGTNPQFISVTK